MKFKQYRADEERKVFIMEEYLKETKMLNFNSAKISD